jgi:surface protein
MDELFYGATQYNSPLENWDVSNVSSMNSMFQNATFFNQNITSWNVSNVSSMNSMFQNAIAFNQNITNWNVSNVSSMNSMFKDASSYNYYVGNWDIGQVTSMNSMFENASSLNQSFYNWQQTYDMSFEFSNNEILMTKQEISTNDVFKNTSNLEYQYVIGNVGNNSIYQTMREFMYNNSLYSEKHVSIENIDTSEITNMDYLFNDSSFNNSVISNWNVSNVTSMRELFRNNPNFNVEINHWDTTKLIDASGMFMNATAFSKDLYKWKLNNCILTNMFNGAISITASNLTQGYIESNWEIFNQYIID